jgi:hypothetical protein
MGQFGSCSGSQPTHANQFLFGSVDKVTSLMLCLLLLYSLLQTRHLSVTTELRRQLQEGPTHQQTAALQKWVCSLRTKLLQT